MAAKLLIIDDDPGLRATIRLALLQEAAVFEAPDGHEGLEVFMKEHPDLTLLDVSMPGMDGLAVLKAVKAAVPAAAVLMLTGEHDIDTARKALDLGAAAYITKPFDLDALRAEVRRLLTPDPKGKRGEDRPWRVGP